MKIIRPSFEILTKINGEQILKDIESYGRTSYKSWDKTTDKSAERFVKMIVGSGHESVIEHAVVTVKIVCNRGISHELVRHRIASYTQESTRYCNYSREKFGKEVQFIKPLFFNKNSQQYGLWLKACELSELFYFKLISSGAKPEEARDVLSNALATEIVVTMNLRSWRNFFKQRTAKDSHPQMREIAVPLLKAFQKEIPIIFDDMVVVDE